MTGRPSILESDPKLVENYLALVRGGISPKAAAAEIDGLSYQSVRNWIKAGEEAKAKEAEGYELDDREARFLDFLDRYTRARSRRLVRVEQAIWRRVNDDDTPTRDLLEIAARIAPEEWGKPEQRIKLEHAGSIDTSGDGAKLARRIDEYEQAFAALDGGDHDGGE